MATRTTKAIRDQFKADNLNIDLFADKFEAWKNSIPKNPDSEFESHLFGKDSAYIAPKVDGKPYLLRHVHLVPLNDLSKLAKWNNKLPHRGRKTSDRVLVYVEDKSERLLIFVLDEPDAHAIATMKTREHKEVMEGFAEIAAAFLFDGTILDTN